MADTHADRSLLLQQIAHFEVFTISLKARFNAGLPISRLPNEVLSDIFDLLPRPTHGVLFFYPEKCREWISVTYVCSRWRSVALGNPRLWTMLMVSNRCLMRLYLKRSQSLPVSLHVSATHGNATTTKGLFGPHSQAVEVALADGPVRMRSLTLEFDLGTIPVAYLDFLTRSPAPNLETFCLITRDCPPVHMPSDIFCEFSPRLRSLHLSNVIASLQLSIFRCDLTELGICNIPDRLRCSTIELLDVLRRLPHLCHLTLNYSLPNPAGTGDALDGQQVHAQFKVSLPSLRCFFMEGTIPECSNLLMVLSIPCDSRTTVTLLNGGPDPFQDNLEITSCFSNLHHHRSEPTCHTSLTKISMWQYMDGCSASFYAYRGDKPMLAIHFQWMDGGQLEAGMSPIYEDFMFRFIMSGAGFTEAKSLEFKSDGYIPFLGSSWPQLSSLISPEVLAVHGTTFSGFIELFARDPDPRVVDEYRDGLRGIHTLEIASVDFGEDEGENLFSILIDSLRRRAFPGGQLRRLTIKDCWINEAQIAQLQDFNLEVDCCEPYTDSEDEDSDDAAHAATLPAVEF